MSDDGDDGEFMDRVRCAAIALVCLVAAGVVILTAAIVRHCA